MKTYDCPLNIRPLDAVDGGGFLVEVPDLPGCVADGATIEEALREIKSAIESWIKTAKEFGDPIPMLQPGQTVQLCKHHLLND